MTKDDARSLAVRIACGIWVVGGCGGGGSDARDQDVGAGGQHPSEAGAGGAGGASVVSQGCTVTRSAPLGGLIADFSPPDGGVPDAGSIGAIEIGGDIYAYGGPATPQYSFSGGAFEIVENASSTSATQYAGVGISFSDCVDASAFKGVSFSIGGSVSGCEMHFTATISEDTYDDGTADSNPQGICTLGLLDCYSPSVAVTGLTAAPQTISFAWPAFLYGMPDQTIDPAKITGIEWSFAIAAGPSGTCTADVVIDDVSFFE